jgi:hypothetical protein
MVPAIMNRLLVYSCVTGNYDAIDAVLLRSAPKPEEGVKFVLYTDKLSKKEKPRKFKVKTVEWELRPLLWQHPLSLRRSARWHKINSHLLPDDAEYTLWLDGSQKIKAISLMNDLVKPLENNWNLATFKHPSRICIYQELSACIKLNKDNPVLMQQQIAKYRAEGYPPYNGLAETACVLRKNCEQITEFNKFWWQQLETHSYRDQLSFNYTAWKLNQPYGRIPGSRAKSVFFEFVPHKPR